MFKNDLFVLGIESSCDETAASVVLNGNKVLSNVIYSQISDHTKFGGVVPEIASRRHIETISSIVSEALTVSKMELSHIDCIAVTYGPGLVGALLVGLSYAKALAYAANKPLIGVNHIEGHICSNFISNPNFSPPFICLVVSGGHTHLVRVIDYGKFEVLGRTRDDAVGEAYDKVARALGLGYPGGPKIDALAKEGDPKAIQFPRTYLEEGSFDFSLSGLKSAVLNYLNKCAMLEQPVNKADVAASFQQAVVDVLTSKSMLACKQLNSKKLALAGGVACNSALRAALRECCMKNDIDLNIPDPIYCTDNAAMIASVGYFNFINTNLEKPLYHKNDYLGLNANSNLALS